MATEIPYNTAAFSVFEVIEATSGELLFAGRTQATSVTTDTRRLEQGSLFVALSGERFDAHRFLAQAVEAGASILLVSDREAASAAFAAYADRRAKERPSLVLVEDTLRALGKLAQIHRRRFMTKIVAVAGSAGKTTTRSVITSLLDQLSPGRVHSTRGNLNNRIGVPMTLLGLKPSHDYAVVEIGTNVPGEVADLTQLTGPEVGVLTLIDLEHTEGLSDLDGVEREEGALFLHLPVDGVAIGYGEDERVLRRVRAARCSTHLTYGELAERELCIESRRPLGPEQVGLSLRRQDGSVLSFNSKLIGRAGALAVAAGVAAAESVTGLRLAASQCESALGHGGEPGRNTLVRLAGARWVLDDSYNSNPASVVVSVETGREIARQTGGRLWLVLGEMLELGTLSTQEHRQMGRVAGQAGAEGVFFVQGAARIAAEICLETHSNTRFFENSSDVAGELAPLVQSQDVVVVKASRGVRAERVVQGLTAAWGIERPSPGSSAEWPTPSERS